MNDRLPKSAAFFFLKQILCGPVYSTFIRSNGINSPNEELLQGHNGDVQTYDFSVKAKVYFVRPRAVYNSAWAWWMLRQHKSSRWYCACVELIRPHSSTVEYTQCFQLSNFVTKFGNFSDYPSNFLPKGTEKQS